MMLIAAAHSVGFSSDKLENALKFTEQYVPLLHAYLHGGKNSTAALREFIQTNVMPARLFTSRDIAKNEAECIYMTTMNRCPSINVVVVDGCNLNCAHCSAIAPLVTKPIYAEYEQLIATLNKLSTLCKGAHAPCELNLYGGEPLLHPELVKIIVAARKIFPQIELGIITNGILLNKMNRITLKMLHECKCNLTIAVYGPGIYFDGVLFYDTPRSPVDCRICFSNPRVVTVASIKHDKHLVYNCEATLHANGDLDFCGNVNAMRILNNYGYGQCLVDGVDYINIHKLHSFAELNKFTNHSTCALSKRCRRTHTVPWKLSTGNINEWIDK